MTRTYAILKVSQSTYNEIALKLKEFGYGDQLHEHAEHGVVIDMFGIALGCDRVAGATKMYELTLTERVHCGDYLHCDVEKLECRPMRKDDRMVTAIVSIKSSPVGTKVKYDPDNPTEDIFVRN
jgi:hypothetical protein